MERVLWTVTVSFQARGLKPQDYIVLADNELTAKELVLDELDTRVLPVLAIDAYRNERTVVKV